MANFWKTSDVYVTVGVVRKDRRRQTDKWAVKSSSRSSENLAQMIFLLLSPIKDVSFEGRRGIWRSLCFSGAVMQSRFSGMTQRNWSLKRHEGLCFLDSGCLKNPNAIWFLQYCLLVKWGIRGGKCNLKVYFRVTCWWENKLCGLLILLKMQSWVKI